MIRWTFPTSAAHCRRQPASRRTAEAPPGAVVTAQHEFECQDAGCHGPRRSRAGAATTRPISPALSQRRLGQPHGGEAPAPGGSRAGQYLTARAGRSWWRGCRLPHPDHRKAIRRMQTAARCRGCRGARSPRWATSMASMSTRRPATPPGSPPLSLGRGRARQAVGSRRAGGPAEARTPASSASQKARPGRSDPRGRGRGEAEERRRLQWSALAPSWLGARSRSFRRRPGPAGEGGGGGHQSRPPPPPPPPPPPHPPGGGGAILARPRSEGDGFTPLSSPVPWRPGRAAPATPR
jgi:hypothetical protein